MTDSQRVTWTIPVTGVSNGMAVGADLYKPRPGGCLHSAASGLFIGDANTCGNRNDLDSIRNSCEVLKIYSPTKYP